MRGKVIPYTVFILCLYFLVFNFPLTPLGLSMGTKNLLYLFLLLVLVINGRKYGSLLKNFGKEFFLLFGAFLYVLFRTLIGGDSDILTKNIYGIIDTFFVPLALVLYAIKSGITTEKQFIRCILILGAVASVISLISFIFPPVQAYIKYNILNLQPETALYWNKYRGFGLAMSLTSSYAYIQGIIFVLGCFYSKDNKWFLFFLPLVLLSVIFNARTGLLILLIGVVIFFVSRKRNFTSFLFGMLAIFMLIFLPDIMQTFGVSSEIREWVAVLFDDIDTIYSSRDLTQTNTGSRLFDSMWILPETESEWLIGKGYSLFRTEIDEHSDTGWILQLNYGGIIYMLFLYPIIIRMVSGLHKIGRKTIAIYIFIVFLIINTKSSFYPASETFRLLMIIYMFFIMTINNNDKKIVYDKSYLRGF